MNAIVSCGCGRSFDADAWVALPSLGLQEVEEGPAGEPAEKLDYRNCPCGSTHAVTVEVFCKEAGGWAWAGDIGEAVWRAAQTRQAVRT